MNTTTASRTPLQHDINGSGYCRLHRSYRCTPQTPELATVTAGPYTCRHAWHQDPSDGLPTCRGDECKGVTVGCGLGAIICNRHRDRRPKSAVYGYDYADPFAPAEAEEAMTDELAGALVAAIRADDRLTKLGDRHTVRDAIAQHDAHAALVRVQLAVGDMRSTFSADAIAQAFAQVGEER
jgi:hypothetical protein